jgi:NADPH:quinone reductase-like Zn-dependent oxidoreductase
LKASRREEDEMSKRAMMRVVRTDRVGPPEVLKVVEVPVPDPGPGQVRIRVTGAAVDYSDVMQRRGSAYPFPTTFPYVPGSEVVGEVDACGAGVEHLARGTRVVAVVGCTGDSGYADFAIAEAARAAPLPPGLDDHAAVGLLIAGTTAVLLLEISRLAAGETILVQGAGGGVGTIALQLARHAGATVIAAASTDDKRSLTRRLGAHHVIDSSRDLAEQVRALGAPDVVLEMTGGSSLEDSLSCLAPFGRVVVYGAARAGTTHRLGQPTLDRWLSDPALGQGVTAFNLGIVFGLRPALAARAMETLFGHVMSGIVTPHVGHVLPLSRAAEAHQLLEERRSIGKIVLDPRKD